MCYSYGMTENTTKTQAERLAENIKAIEKRPVSNGSWLTKRTDK